MKITRKQLGRIIKERIGGGSRYSELTAHPRSELGKNIADVDFPILVRYRGQSEVLYDQGSLDELLDDLGPNTPYSLDSLSDVEALDIPVGKGIERYSESKQMKITKRQLRRIIKEAFADYADERPNNPMERAYAKKEEANSFSTRRAIAVGIRDAIIGHIEDEKFFEMGAIPQSVIKVIENSSLRVAEAVGEHDG